jgi:hypothetical protein
MSEEKEATVSARQTILTAAASPPVLNPARETPKAAEATGHPEPWSGFPDAAHGWWHHVLGMLSLRRDFASQYA